MNFRFFFKLLIGELDMKFSSSIHFWLEKQVFHLLFHFRDLNCQIENNGKPEKSLFWRIYYISLSIKWDSLFFVLWKDLEIIPTTFLFHFHWTLESCLLWNVCVLQSGGIISTCSLGTIFKCGKLCNEMFANLVKTYWKLSKYYAIFKVFCRIKKNVAWLMVARLFN